ncbi:MAG: chemotaxis protein CheW, partial [Gammaproteobacteria bacterium]|nr:chemotaxis protein CheW [Gammaproteobacteria bacterium]
QHLTFDLSDEELAVPVMNIREIIRYGKLTKMPMVPNFIEGVINLRGNVVPVINLASKFALETKSNDKRTCIIIMEVDINDESVVMGIVVDKVLQVIEIPDDDIEPTPTLGAKIQTNFIKGMAKKDDGFTIILDISQVLSAEEVAIVSDMHKSSDSEN